MADKKCQTFETKTWQKMLCIFCQVFVSVLHLKQKYYLKHWQKMFDKKRESFETKNVLHFLSVFAFFVSKAKRVPGQVSIQLLKKKYVLSIIFYYKYEGKKNYQIKLF